MTLERLRLEIDEINLKIIELLAKRLEVTQKVARVKKECELPVEDQIREYMQYQKLKELAILYELNPAVIEKIFMLVIEYCKAKMREDI